MEDGFFIALRFIQNDKPGALVILRLILAGVLMAGHRRIALIAVRLVRYPACGCHSGVDEVDRRIYPMVASLRSA